MAITIDWQNKLVLSTASITDIVARIMADHVRTKLGQSVIVENRTGANGMLAATEVVCTY